MKRHIILALILIPSLGSADSIKKWTDAEGNVHFGDIPPAGIATDQVVVKNKPATQPRRSRSTISDEFKALVDDMGSGRYRTKKQSTKKKDDGRRSYGERLRYKNAARSGEVLIGMTSKELVTALGRPVRINESAGSYGNDEQWVYATPSGSRYIYLENDQVTGWN